MFKWSDTYVQELVQNLTYEREENRTRSRTIQKLADERSIIEKQYRDLSLEFIRLKKKYKQLKAQKDSSGVV